MSRPINYNNNSGGGTSTNSAGTLQIINNQGTTSTITNQASLTIDTLNVKNIYLLNSLYTKTAVDVNAPNRLQITQGSIVNQFTSADVTKKSLAYNNVYFQPDASIPTRVTIFALDKLIIGRSMIPLDLNASIVTLNGSFKVLGQTDFKGLSQFDNLNVTTDLQYGNNVFQMGDSSLSNVDIVFRVIDDNNGIIRFHPNANPSKSFYA